MENENTITEALDQLSQDHDEGFKEIREIKSMLVRVIQNQEKILEKEGE